MLITSGATGGKTHPLGYSVLQELDIIAYKNLLPNT